jgi:tRNA (cmo5U34)-methyltransferase
VNPSHDKSTVDDIRRRFDQDVERFSNLETGQSATVDAPLVLELITTAAAAVDPDARDLLDVGCGAGNYSLKLLERLPGMNVTLIDLSGPMLERAVQRVNATGAIGAVTAMQGDVRDLDLGAARFDVILAAAVLHHLRDDSQWRAVFAKFHRALRPGGSIWIADLVSHTFETVQDMMWQRYGDYLTQLRDKRYRDDVFAYIQKEDTPRSLAFQLDVLRDVGFQQVEVLHKNNCFAAFGAVK